MPQSYWQLLKESDFSPRILCSILLLIRFLLQLFVHVQCIICICTYKDIVMCSYSIFLSYYYVDGWYWIFMTHIPAISVTVLDASDTRQLQRNLQQWKHNLSTVEYYRKENNGEPQTWRREWVEEAKEPKDLHGMEDIGHPSPVRKGCLLCMLSEMKRSLSLRSCRTSQELLRVQAAK